MRIKMILNQCNEIRSPLAQDAVDGKSMKGWALLKKVPFGSPDNKINYMWVAVFDDINQWLTENNGG